MASTWHPNFMMQVIFLFNRSNYSTFEMLHVFLIIKLCVFYCANVIILIFKMSFSSETLKKKVK